MKPFRLRRDVTLLATQDAQKLLGAMTTATITGALEYQACDDKVCFNPTRIPVSFDLKLKPLDRNRRADRVIIAVAQVEQLTIVTSDDQFDRCHLPLIDARQ